MPWPNSDSDSNEIGRNDDGECVQPNGDPCDGGCGGQCDEDE